MLHLNFFFIGTRVRCLGELTTWRKDGKEMVVVVNSRNVFTKEHESNDISIIRH